MEQGETSAQMPPDYVAVAEVAMGLEEESFALGIYEQAEEICFDAMEFAVVGHRLAVNTDQAGKAWESLQRAAEQAAGTPDMLSLCDRAMAVLNDADMCRPLLESAEAQVTSVGEMKNLLAADTSESGGDRFFWVHLGNLAAQFGDDAGADGYFDQAAARRPPVAIPDSHTLYEGMREKMQKLAWVEGIQTLFRDDDWARQAFDELTSEMNDGDDKVIFERSRDLRFGHNFRSHTH